MSNNDHNVTQQLPINWSVPVTKMEPVAMPFARCLRAAKSVTVPMTFSVDAGIAAIRGMAAQ